MANNMARIGMPSQQYNNQLNAINQNQAGGLGALAQSANPAAGIASIVRQGNIANGQLNSQDAQARQANERYAIGQNAQLGQQQLAAQQYNKFDKYSEGFNQSQALRGAANQNLQNGINGAGQMASTLYGMGQGGSQGRGLSATDNAALAQNGIAQQQQLDQTANGFNQYLGTQQIRQNSNPFITNNWGG